MLLAVDVGNTKIKAAVFEGANLLTKVSFEKNEALRGFKKILKNFPGITNSVASVVGKDEDELFLWLGSHTRLTQISHQLRFPFANKYATPHTLGIDRMVLAAGAVQAFPGRGRLVIDAGTCITYDFIAADDTYYGGAISPGLQLRYNALHNFTAKLPLLQPEVPRDMTGNSTSQSIHSGVVHGILNEVEGFIAQYREQYQQLTIILTGGDTDFLAKQLKSTIFANSNFLLESLNLLYLYSIKND